MTAREMRKKIHWLGHDGFRIDASKTVYVDPFQIEAGPDADIVPMHYGAIVGDDSDAEKFASALEGKMEVVVLEKTA